jgi:MFS family permease
MKPCPTKARFVVLAFLCAAAALAYVSRNAIAVAESTVRGDLGLSKQQSGWLMSAFFFSYALCQIHGAVCNALVPARLAHLRRGLVFRRGDCGQRSRRIRGLAPCRDCASRLISSLTLTVSKWFPKTGRAFATGALGSFMSLGGALCAWLTGVLLEVLEPHVAPGWNWRFTFLVFAAPGWSGRSALNWFRNGPSEHKAVNSGARLIRRDI